MTAVNAPSVSPVHTALSVVAAALQSPFVALVEKQGTELRVLDNQRKDAINGLELVLPDALQGRTGLISLSGQRVSASWVMAAGIRPGHVFLQDLIHGPWCLLAVFPESGKLPSPALCADCLQLLSPLYAQGRLAASERREAARLHALIAQLDTPLLVVLSDEQGVLFNPAAAQLINLPQRPLQPADVALCLQAFFAACDDKVQSVLRTLETDPGATIQCSLERQDRHWDVLSRRIKDPALDGRFWLFSDITQGVQQQQLLMAGMHNETIARISGGMAHQFNNLLTVILGNAEVLSEYPGLDEPSQRQLSSLLKAAETGADIIAELLAYGQRQAHPGEVFDAAEECRLLLPLFRQLLTPGITLQTEGLEKCYPLRCDRKLFADALVHAVLNARDALGDKGRVVIRLQAAPPATDSAQGEVSLSVEDNGHGMDEATRRRAFEPFFTTRGLATSRGLGLSVVEGFVTASGGQVSLSSESGMGTALRMVLPLAPEAMAEK